MILQEQKTYQLPFSGADRFYFIRLTFFCFAFYLFIEGLYLNLGYLPYAVDCEFNMELVASAVVVSGVDNE